MARIIRHLDEHFQEQPELGELAAIAGLSEGHFQRRFSEWVGVSPKAFLKCLTLEHAREVLRRGDSVLAAALESGLSGPGRLHDLCVTLEAVSPGELKAGGRGLTITWGVADSPFGNCRVASTARGICHLTFLEESEVALPQAALAEDWPQATLVRDDTHAAQVLGAIFREGNEQAKLRAWVAGTPFQLRVWRALLQLPSGSLTSYGRLARAIGQPSAARAVGSAVGANPLALLIPCHRVIRETGALGGYRWNRGRKRALVAWEGADRAC